MAFDCEWNLIENRPLTPEEFRNMEPHAKAMFFLGNKKQIAVCEECAKSPKLAKYKVRRRIDEKN